MEGQNQKSIKYNLTPMGFKEKVELTLRYIQISYAAVIKLTDNVSEIAAEYTKKNTKIYIINQQDEMTEIVKIALDRISAEYKMIQSTTEINNKEKHILFTWGNQSYPGIETVNILA